MLKKILSVVLVAFFAVGLSLLAGCEQNEVKTQRHIEVQHTEQHEVVE